MNNVDENSSLGVVSQHSNAFQAQHRIIVVQAKDFVSKHVNIWWDVKIKICRTIIDMVIARQAKETDSINIVAHLILILYKLLLILLLTHYTIPIMIFRVHCPKTIDLIPNATELNIPSENILSV